MGFPDFSVDTHRENLLKAQWLRDGTAAESFAGSVCGSCRIRICDDLLQNQEPGDLYSNP